MFHVLLFQYLVCAIRFRTCLHVIRAMCSFHYVYTWRTLKFLWKVVVRVILAQIIGWSLAALKSRSIRKLMALKAHDNFYHLSETSSFSIILHYFGPQCFCLRTKYFKSLLSSSYCRINGKFIHLYRNLVRVSAFVTFKLISKPRLGPAAKMQQLTPTHNFEF